MSQPVVRDRFTPLEDGTPPARLTGATGLHKGSQTHPLSAMGKPVLQAAIELSDQPRALAIGRERLARAERAFPGPDARCKVHELGARRAAHQRTLERMSSAVLVLRRGNLALKQEVARVRVELARLRGGRDSWCAVTSTEVKI